MWARQPKARAVTLCWGLAEVQAQLLTLQLATALPTPSVPPPVYLPGSTPAQRPSQCSLWGPHMVLPRLSSKGRKLECASAGPSLEGARLVLLPSKRSLQWCTAPGENSHNLKRPHCWNCRESSPGAGEPHVLVNSINNNNPQSL